MFLNRNRLHHALSSFNHVTHCWAAIPLCDPHDSITQRPSSHPADAISKQSLCLMSWNIQTWPITHSKLIQFPLNDPRVCSGSWQPILRTTHLTRPWHCSLASILALCCLTRRVREGGSWCSTVSSAWSCLAGMGGMHSVWISPPQLHLAQYTISLTCTLTPSTHISGMLYRCWHWLPPAWAQM